MRRTKMGRPRVEEKGYVYAFYAPPEMSDELEKILQYTGGTISVFLRDAVNDKIKAIQADHKRKMLEQYRQGEGIPTEIHQGEVMNEKKQRG